MRDQTPAVTFESPLGSLSPGSGDATRAGAAAGGKRYRSPSTPAATAKRRAAVARFNRDIHALKNSGKWKDD